MVRSPSGDVSRRLNSVSLPCTRPSFQQLAGSRQVQQYLAVSTPQRLARLFTRNQVQLQLSKPVIMRGLDLL